MQEKTRNLSRLFPHGGPEILKSPGGQKTREFHGIFLGRDIFHYFLKVTF